MSRAQDRAGPSGTDKQNEAATLAEPLDAGLRDVASPSASEWREYRKKVTIYAQEMVSDFVVETPEGRMVGVAGDFLARGAAGERYPIKRAIFFDTYEPVEGEVQLVETTPATVIVGEKVVITQEFDEMAHPLTIEEQESEVEIAPEPFSPEGTTEFDPEARPEEG